MQSYKIQLYKKHFNFTPSPFERAFLKNVTFSTRIYSIFHKHAGIPHSFQLRRARQIHSRSYTIRPTVNHKHLSFTTNESADKIANASPTGNAIRYSQEIASTKDRLN